MRLYAEPINDTPGIPSVIVTANRVDQFLSNTGSFSGSFTGVLNGTASFATSASFLTSNTNAFIQGGNSFGTTALLGTNDTQNLQFETNGLVRMTVSSSGNVGIGNTQPTLGLLQVGGNVYATSFTGSGLQITGSTTTDLVRITQTGAGNAFVVEDESNPDSTPFVINNSGVVGIGTTTPTYQLDIKSNDPQLRVYADVNNRAFRLIPSNGTIESDNVAFYLNRLSTNNILLGVGGGNVGIGTQVPNAKLDVSGSVIITGSLTTRMDSTNTVQLIGSSSNLQYLPDSIGGDLRLQATTTGLPRITIVIPSSSTKPTAGFQFGMRTWDDTIYSGYGKVGDAFFYGGNETNGVNFMNPVGTGTEDYIRFYAGKTANNQPDIHIQGSGSTIGNVGIGKITPNAKLDVNGSVIITGSLSVTSVGNNTGSFVTINGNNTLNSRTAAQVRVDINYYGLTYAMQNGYY